MRHDPFDEMRRQAGGHRGGEERHEGRAGRRRLFEFRLYIRAREMIYFMNGVSRVGIAFFTLSTVMLSCVLICITATDVQYISYIPTTCLTGCIIMSK